MVWLIAAVALAFPLNRPDPKRMDGLRCLRYPVDLQNNVETTDYTPTDRPPVTPMYSFDPGTIPSDDALKKAAKGKGMYALPAVASLATEGRPIIVSCDRKASAQDDFTRGCKKPLGCTVQIVVNDRPKQAMDSDQIGPWVAPIDTAAKAVGVVALMDDDVFLPLTPEEQAAWVEQSAGYRVLSPENPWFEVERRNDGWLVHAARKVTCGCEHDLVRRSYWVDTKGRLCQLELPAVPLALAPEAECKDG